MNLHLDFVWHVSYCSSDFVVFDGNVNAYTLINSVGSGNLLINGPRFSGKTHLGHIFRKQNPYAHVYDIDAGELSEDDIMMILYDTSSVNLWLSNYHIFELKDLQTRFNAMLYAKIAEPDEDAFVKIMMKCLFDYGFDDTFDVCKYVSLRTDLRYQTIHDFVELAHSTCVERKLSINVANYIIEMMYMNQSIDE